MIPSSHLGITWDLQGDHMAFLEGERSYLELIRFLGPKSRSGGCALPIELADNKMI